MQENLAYFFMVIYNYIGNKIKGGYMKRGYIIVIIILLCIIGHLGLFESGVIRNYKIKDFDIVANVDTAGNMRVVEETEYRFNGKYNGITITLPKNISNEYYESKTQNSINDSVFKDYLYNNTGLSNVSIYIVRDGEREKLNEVGSASLGQSGVYTVEYDSEGYVTYKIYEPSKNENKTFIIEYTLENVALKHKDVGEVFWNFVGGNVECRIDNLDIELSIASGNLKDGYIHGNESGKITELSKNTIKLNYKYIGKNEFVGVRAVFPTESIKNSVKISNMNGLDIIKEQEEGYNKKTNIRVTLNIITIIITAVLLLYWIYLLIRYEKDVLYKVEDFDEMSILEKYNPIISACIAQNRDMQPRDILAALIDLVNRKVLDLETIKKVNQKNGKEEIEYKLTKSEKFFDDSIELDDIDRTVIAIFFDGNTSIKLKARLKEIKNGSGMLRRISKLDNAVTEKLEKIGANFVRVPKRLLTLNNVIFVLVLIYVFAVICVNISLGYSTNTTSDTEMITKVTNGAAFLLIVIAIAYPAVLFVLMFGGSVMLFFKKIMTKFTIKFSGKRLTQTLISLAILFVIIFILEGVFVHKAYLIISTILVMMAYLLIMTDNLMTSHSLKVRNDYFYLKSIQDKIENGSLLDEKGIESQILWERYLTFAIALGVGNVAGLVANIPNINDIVEDFDKYSDKLYELYARNRNIEFETKIERFTSKMSSALDSYGLSSGGSSFGGSSSSFGGGGFSGGGGGGGGRGAF